MDSRLHVEIMPFGRHDGQDRDEHSFPRTNATTSRYVRSTPVRRVSYANGRGVPQDYVQAHMWANLAAARRTGEDREHSVSLRDRIAEELTPDDLSEAQRLAREWDAAHPQ